MDELVLREESGGDLVAVEALFDRVFGPARKSLSSYKLRQGVLPVRELCLVVSSSGGLPAGAVRFWPVRIGGSGVPALLAGPVGVDPTRQGEGLGAALLRAGLTRAERLAMPADTGEAGRWKRVVLVGDEPYYGRFGFRRDLAEALRFPSPTDPARVLACELEPGAMSGIGGRVASWHRSSGKSRWPR